jgi:hypothetical protein
VLIVSLCDSTESDASHRARGRAGAGAVTGGLYFRSHGDRSGMGMGGHGPSARIDEQVSIQTYMSRRSRMPMCERSWTFRDEIGTEIQVGKETHDEIRVRLITVM